MTPKISKTARRLFAALTAAAFLASDANAGHPSFGGGGGSGHTSSQTASSNFSSQFSNHTTSSVGASQVVHASSLSLSPSLQSKVISGNVGQSTITPKSTNITQTTTSSIGKVLQNTTNSPLTPGTQLKTQNTGIAGNLKNVNVSNLTNQGSKLQNQLKLTTTGQTSQVGKLNLGSQLQKGNGISSLNLGKQLASNGGSAKNISGLLSNNFSQSCKSHYYCGPIGCPNVCSYPCWCPWVNWCWYYNPCDYCDPRPTCCQPCVYYPCTPCCVDYYPTCNALYTSDCGTWVDVPTVTATGCDVQLLAVRFVDGGHPDQQLGPRYRVWVRNNSSTPIDKPFNVSLFAAADESITTSTPQGGVRVTKMDANETQAVDVRLPFSLTQASADQGSKFENLKVLVDSKNELNETDRANNGTSIAREQIQPVDPALFAAEDKNVTAGSMVNLSGEGLGPEAGQLILTINNQPYQAEIQGWFDMGLQAKLPSLALTGPTAAQLVVVRADGTTSNAVDVTLNPASAPVAGNEQVSSLEQ
jgi:hypothetical protein